MAEKGVLIKEQAEGKNLATMDALALDGDSNARVIQQMDLSYGHLPSPLVPIRANVAVPDTLDLDNLPAELLNNLMDCGDKSRIIVFVVIPNAVYNQGAMITPLLFDNEATPGCMGYIDNYVCGAKNNYMFTGSGDGITQIFSDDLVGSPKIGIHVTQGYMTFTPGVNVYAYLL